MDTCTYIEDGEGGYLMFRGGTPKHPSNVIMDNLFRELDAASIALNKELIAKSLVIKYTDDRYPNGYFTITSVEGVTDLKVALRSEDGTVLTDTNCGMHILYVQYAITALIQDSQSKGNS